MTSRSLSILTVIAFSACGPDPTEAVQTDNLGEVPKVYLSAGTYMAIDAGSGVFDLGAPARFEARIVNESDSAPYLRSFGGAPYHSVKIWDENGRLVYVASLSWNPADSILAIPLRDSTTISFSWWQIEQLHPNVGNQAFSGRYRVRISLTGNEQYCQTWIRLSDNGTRLGATLVGRNHPDSVLVRFYVRNRTSQPIDRSLFSVIPELVLLRTGAWSDTALFVSHSSLPTVLSAHSDYLCIELAKSKTDTIFTGLSGSYDFVASITNPWGGPGSGPFAVSF